MTPKPPDPILPDDFDDNPEWTDEDLARARPAREVMGDAFVDKMTRKPDAADPEPGDDPA